MAALAERRIIPHDELKSRKERKDSEAAELRPEHLRLLEALLFAASVPLDEKTLGARLPEDVDLRQTLRALQAEYAPRGVNLVKVGTKWAFRTANDLSWLLTKEAVIPKKLSRAAIETLSVIAYHQPVTRVEVEEIRGVVMSKGTFDVLMETGWIRPRGRRKTPGRPITYGTTETFLSHFQLGSADRPAGPRGAERLRPARRPPAAGLRGAGAVGRSGAARRRGPARAGRSRSGARAAAGAGRGIASVIPGPPRAGTRNPDAHSSRWIRVRRCAAPGMTVFARLAMTARRLRAPLVNLVFAPLGA